MHIFIPTVTLKSWGAYVSVGILSNNVWLTISAIAIISLLGKFLNRFKTKWAALESRTSVQCDYSTKTWPWAYLEFSLSVPIVWIRSGTLPLEIAHSILQWDKKLLCLELKFILVLFSGVARGGVGVFKPPPPKFQSFDKVEPDCKLSGKCLVFLFQHPN